MRFFIIINAQYQCLTSLVRCRISDMNQPQEAAVDQQVPCPCELKSLIFNMDFGAGE